MDPGWQVFEFLCQYLDRCIDQQLRPFQSLFLQLAQDCGDFSTALALVVAVGNLEIYAALRLVGQAGAIPRNTECFSLVSPIFLGWEVLGS